MAVTKAQVLEIFKTLGMPTEIEDDVIFTEQGFDSIDVPRALAAIGKQFSLNLSGVKGEQVKNMTLLLGYINSK